MQAVKKQKKLYNLPYNPKITACIYGIESRFYTLQLEKMKNLELKNVLGHVNQFDLDEWNKNSFISYESLCCVLDWDLYKITFWRDWDYSKTTLKHLYAFLNEYNIQLNSKKDVQKTIENWVYHWTHATRTVEYDEQMF